MYNIKTINGKELKFNKVSHIYYLDKMVVPSCTTITSLIDKSGALMGWQANLITEKLPQKFDEIVKGEFIPTEENVKEYMKYLKTLSKTAKENAADFGIRTHKVIEYDLKGTPIKVDKEIKLPYKGYKNWKTEYSKFKTVASEIMTFGEIPCKYAGTADMIVELDGRTVLGDLKTSSGIYPSYLLQLSAYRHGLEVNNGIPIESMGILKLSKDSSNHKWVEFTDKEYEIGYRAFTHLCKFYHAYRKAEIAMR